MFEALRTPRRVILSGTPIQNELSEFHAMVCSSPAAREDTHLNICRPTSATQDYLVGNFNT